MIRLGLIAALAIVAFLLLRYNSNEKVRRWIVTGIGVTFVAYLVSLVVFELIR